MSKAAAARQFNTTPKTVGKWDGPGLVICTRLGGAGANDQLINAAACGRFRGQAAPNTRHKSGKARIA